MRPGNLFLILVFLLNGCNIPQDLPEPAVVQSTATDAPTVIPTPTVFDPYANLSIDALSSRPYGEGQIIDLSMISEAVNFNRHLISFNSDGLVINGFADIPFGTGPFPVIILLHGYVDPAEFQVETYTARYAASFANEGFIVIHPNYRNYAPSDFGPNLFRVGFAIDVLNLIAEVNAQAGKPGLLETANPDAIFLWGHSMGGGIALRVLTVGADVQGAVVYGSMGGDDRRNFEHIRDVLSEGERGNEELTAPEEVFQLVSPINFYDRITVPISIHHGDLDEYVPFEWSTELCSLLQALGKSVECFSYHNMPHTFYGSLDDLLIQRSIEFFLRYTPVQ